MESLGRWCADQLGVPALERGPVSVSGDASFRRYYRVWSNGCAYIAVHAPPDKEDNAAFVRVDRLLQAAGLCVPEVLAWEPERGFLLLSDFGDQLLLPLLTPASVEDHYRTALATLETLQQIDPAGAELPPYDARRLRDEMALFPQWFVGELLHCELNDDERAMLERLFDQLIDSALAQPQVVVHRDFHSRNLMALPDGRLGVIDFQDAVVGPVTYDLVSLLRDCYIAWPDERVRGWAGQFFQRARERGLALPAACTEQQWLRWFDLMGLQRHLKVLGIFARLSLRDAKAGYLSDLPLVIAYTLREARGHPEGLAFADWFERRLMPLIARQHWFQSLPEPTR